MPAQENNLKIGFIVRAWDPDLHIGKIVHLTDEHIYVLFRNSGVGVRKFPVGSPPLHPWSPWPFPHIDFPPVLKRGDDWLLADHAMFLRPAIARFLKRFPRGFSDPKYIGPRAHSQGALTPANWRPAIAQFLKRFSLGFSEMEYVSLRGHLERDVPRACGRHARWIAHEQFEKELGGGKAKELLRKNKLGLLKSRALSVICTADLLTPDESAALQEAFKDDAATANFFRCLIDLLDAPPIAIDIKKAYFDSVLSLPVTPGKPCVATWSVATILPFLAKPQQILFVDSQLFQAPAALSGMNILINPQPNWQNFAFLSGSADRMMQELKILKPVDCIDLHSFISFAFADVDCTPLNS